MKYKRFGNKVIVRIDSGEEIVKTLGKICKNLKINFGTVSGIGATNKAIIGLFNSNTKQYQSTELRGDHEIAPLYGNVSTLGSNIYLHLHANLCNEDHKSYGGHLNSAIVSVTFECIIDIIDGEINRVFDEKIGLNPLDL
ncbi:MAG: PPC domain-containing DNA-binding protein [Candidatus Hodarchaeota archaeon]